MALTTLMRMSWELLDRLSGRDLGKNQIDMFVGLGNGVSKRNIICQNSQ